MKKISTFLAVIGMIVISSCEGPQGPPGFDGLDGQDGLIAEVFELKNVDLEFVTFDEYSIFQTLTPQIFASDVILIYRMTGTIDANTPIWRLIPNAVSPAPPQGTVNYDFDFSKEDFTIYVRGTYDLSLTPQYIDNQTFRIVIVPGDFSASINKNNYAEVMAALNIKESQIQSINF
ncbi:MAG TPA: hypothetical protein VIH09_06330 [Flavobacterium sp.]|uniref:hypothetical protein n=1 Tax=Flavobacterium sp. TaxID=239 RepID=UPI002F3EDC58